MKPVLKTLSSLVRRNVEHALQMRAFFETRVGTHQRRVESATAWLGRPLMLYILIGSCAAWISYNLWLYPFVGVQLDAPPFMWLQGSLCFYGAMVATMVLAAQNRRNQEAEQRDHLQLQLTLVTEQKTTKIISLLEELRRDMPSVQDRDRPSLHDMLEGLDPQHLVSALDSVLTGPTDAEVLKEDAPLEAAAKPGR
ncbi:MAG: hypothetical protein JWN04_6879 [Myxococcaceae bacterium]|nr:hypothetical protein [Myxococcaceae bacterium]